MHERDPRRLICALSRSLFKRGWMEGTAGNLSIRQGETLYITASGRPKGSLTLEDILAIGLSERLADNHEARRPSAETSIHRAIYELFPDMGAVLHVHTIDAALISESAPENLPLPPLEVLKGLGISDPRHAPALPVFENDLHVPNIAKEITRRMSVHPSPLPGLLIRLHGTTVWGRSLEEAVRHLELLEFTFRFMVARNSRSVVHNPSSQDASGSA